MNHSWNQEFLDRFGNLWTRRSTTLEMPQRGRSPAAGHSSIGSDVGHMHQDAALLRKLTVTDAVFIGLASMIGAGVFAVFGPAAKAAGNGLLIGLAIAFVIAFCNAVASAQLAAVYPASGGTYVYGRERLNEWWGFVAGWGFVIGKTASCAAMAMTIASYAVGGPVWLQRGIAVAATLTLTGINSRGVTKTALASRILVLVTISCLAAFVVATLGFGDLHPSLLRHPGPLSSSAYGVLQSAGLIFFAFAGYARIATLGEEVREPETSIPRAIPLALVIVGFVYLVVALTLLSTAGASSIAGSTAPLITSARAADVSFVVPVIRFGAIVAAAGSLLSLIAGVGRTSLAMARNRDLPRWFAVVHDVYRVPHHAEWAVGIIVSLIVLFADLRGAIGFSSFGVLIYYSIANASAYTQPPSQRRWPKALNLLGVTGCVVLVATLPSRSVVLGLLVFAIGLLGRFAVIRLRDRDPDRKVR